MNRKQINKQSRLILPLLLIVGISIGYAALSSTLNINGNTNIKTAKWDIHFENLVKTAGSVTATKDAAIDTTKMLIEYTISLQQPGDFYDFTVDVANTGSIDAMVSKVVKTGLDDSQSKYIIYTATYADGTEIKEKDKLSAGDKKSIKVRVKYRYDLNPEDLPTEGKPFSLEFQIIYVQADDTAKDVFPAFPTYFNFGTPTTSSTTNYKTLGKNVFVTLGSDGSTGVCIDNNGLFCLKPNEFEKSQAILKEYFRNECSGSGTSYFYCRSSTFACDTYLNGNASCRDFTANEACTVYASGTFSCH